MTATEPESGDRLAPYRAKRSADRTPEPSGGPVRGGGSTYVFHKHAASHLHWDLRLEMDGVLVSWAVPKGPSYDPAEKRLAVHVEDHPLEYGEFEGRIPEGNYGAGAVIIWDRGSWMPHGDPAQGLRDGKLLFELKGYKLRGLWTLVKLKKGEREWLLIKERDAYAVPGGKEIPEESVLSGLRAEDLKHGVDRADPILTAIQAAGAPERPLDPAAWRPMLAESADRPFTRDGWVFEPKLDGYRILAALEGGVPRLVTRSGRDATQTFPEVARAVQGLPFDRVLLDGEVVAVDDAGRPSFQHLQQRAKFLRPADIRRAAVTLPVTYYAFDLLGFGPYDLRPLPLTTRKELLRRVLPPVGPILYLEHFAREGERLFGETTKLGLEGIVAKRADAAYVEGRSAAWQKIRVDRTGDFIVVGFTAPKGSRAGLGALHLAEWVGETLTYVGRVGSGFTEDALEGLRAELDRHLVDQPPCAGPLPADAGTRWVEPLAVCEVRFTERTADGLLRHPVFLRFRDDKTPAECRRASDSPAQDEPPPLLEDPPPTREVRFSNLEKVFWPVEGYTKGDLVGYYRAIAPWMLPYLRDRPLVLTRYPDGIDGKSFFQKDAPAFVPEWLRREVIWSEQAAREIGYFICDDEATLLYVANMAAIPLHIWASRVGSLERPDWCVLDLDPKEAPFASVVRVAQVVRDLCESLGLPSFVKTTGSTGLHVLLPLGRQLTHEQSRTLGELLARIVVAEAPEIATIDRVIERREGKVYVDYLQNGHGKLIVAPFSARPVPGARVSMPLDWSEVTGALRLDTYTITTAPALMATRGTDPMAPVLAAVPDVREVLEQVGRRGGLGPSG